MFKRALFFIILITITSSNIYSGGIPEDEEVKDYQEIYNLNPPETNKISKKQAKAKHYKSVTFEDRIHDYKLKLEDKNLYFKLPVALGRATTIVFPDDVKLSAPHTLGNKSLIQTQIVPNPLELKLWGKKFNQSQVDSSMIGQSTNLIIKLNTGQTLIFEITIVPAESAVLRVNFLFPEFENSIAEVRKAWIAKEAEIKRAEEEMLKNIDEIAHRKKLELLAEDFGKYWSCNTYDVRGNSGRELVFFMSDRICKFGEGTIVLNFVIKNGSRKYFYADQIKVYIYAKDSLIEIPSNKLISKISKKGLLYDEEAVGAVIFELSSSEYSRRYKVLLIEKHGRKIKVDVTVGF